MVTIKKFRGTKHYLMGNKDICIEYNSNNGDNKKNITVQVKKRQSTSALSNETVQKKQKHSPADLMGKLEEFSDIWNDCPEINNLNQSVNNSKGNKNHDHNYKPTSINFKKPSVKFEFESKAQEEHFAKVKCLKSSNKTRQNESTESSKSSTVKQNKGDKNLEDILEGKDKITQRELHVSYKAEEKRVKAVKEQIQLHVNKKNIIKQALSSLDSDPNKRINKKIIFNDDNDSSVIHNETEKSKSSGRMQLFEEEGSDNETELKVNSQFKGKKGQKLLALQSKFSSDSRFTLDKRFAESGSDSEDETLKNEDQNSEKLKQFKILESIVGRPLKLRSDTKNLTKTPQTLLLRFDPLREDHSQFIVKPPGPKEEEEDKSIKKKKGKKAKEENAMQEEENRHKVHIERFYKVKDELKETFRGEESQEFSLLKLFGPKDLKEPTSRPEQSQSVKKQKHKTKSPFKYDSSDSETEDRKEADAVQRNEQCKDVKSEPQNKNFSWYTSFFFVEDDPRFEEALEFLKVPEKTQDDKKEYIQTRKTLKDFMKRRYKNNLKNKGIFKKKLGGGKQGGVRKKKENKS